MGLFQISKWVLPDKMAPAAHLAMVAFEGSAWERLSFKRLLPKPNATTWVRSRTCVLQNDQGAFFCCLARNLDLRKEH